MKKQLATIPSDLAIVQRPPDVAAMLSAVIDKGVSAENVAVIEQMVALYERMEKRQSEKDFAVALVNLQSETGRIQARKAVDVKNGVPRYSFAPYEDIMGKAQPILTLHGFSVTFDTSIEGDRMISHCTLTHKSGHSRTNKFAVRFTTPPGSNASQGDMSTKSYAKRGALCDALNIVVSHDDDARMVGGPVSESVAEDLETRAKACGADEEALLKFAGATSYENIPEGRLPEIIQQLERREAKNKKILESEKAEGALL